MRRTYCGSCYSTDLRPVLDLGLSPIADAYLETATESYDIHPLQLGVCGACWLVQLLDVVDHDVLFGKSYSFYSSASQPLSEYHRRYAWWLLSNFSQLMRDHGVVEVGSNDGDFARHLVDADISVTGVDPAEGPAVVAASRGVGTLMKPFTRELASELRDSRGRVGVVVANHVLAHVEDVADVLAGIAHLLTDDGVAVIEVQHVGDLLVHNAWDLIYHEHRNHFSLLSLERAVRRWNLRVVDCVRTTRQAGSLRVVLARPRSEWFQLRTSAVERCRMQDMWLDRFGTYDGLQGRVEHARVRLRHMLEDIRPSDVVAGYGAPAKATTLLNYCDIDHNTLAFVTDTTTAKQGRYIPGTGIQILTPALAPNVDVYLLLAWNYLSQVLAREACRQSARWIVPVPVPTEVWTP